jgi:hypothetical protein
MRCVISTILLLAAVSAHAETDDFTSNLRGER